MVVASGRGRAGQPARWPTCTAPSCRSARCTAWTGSAAPPGRAAATTTRRWPPATPRPSTAATCVNRPGCARRTPTGAPSTSTPGRTPTARRPGSVPNSWWMSRSHPRVAWRSSRHAVVQIMARHDLRWTYGNGDTQHFDAASERPRGDGAGLHAARRGRLRLTGRRRTAGPLGRASHGTADLSVLCDRGRARPGRPWCSTTDDLVGFLDPRPVFKGHVLLVPARARGHAARPPRRAAGPVPGGRAAARDRDRRGARRPGRPSSR